MARRRDNGWMVGCMDGGQETEAGVVGHQQAHKTAIESVDRCRSQEMRDGAVTGGQTDPVFGQWCRKMWFKRAALFFFFFPYFFLISSRISSLPERTSISTPALPKAVTRPRRRSAMLGRWADPLQSLQPILNLGKGLQFPCHVVLYRSNEYSGTPRLMTRLLFLYNYVL